MFNVLRGACVIQACTLHGLFLRTYRTDVLLRQHNAAASWAYAVPCRLCRAWPLWQEGGVTAPRRMTENDMASSVDQDGATAQLRCSHDCMQERFHAILHVHNLLWPGDCGPKITVREQENSAPTCQAVRQAMFDSNWFGQVKVP